MSVSEGVQMEREEDILEVETINIRSAKPPTADGTTGCKPLQTKIKPLSNGRDRL